MIDLQERMLPTWAGVEPATSWSPVGWRIQMSTEASPNSVEDNQMKLTVGRTEWEGKSECKNHNSALINCRILSPKLPFKKKIPILFGWKKCLIWSFEILVQSCLKTPFHLLHLLYRIWSNYRTYPYKCTVKHCVVFRLQPGVFICFFIKAYAVGTNLNCLDK